MSENKDTSSALTRALCAARLAMKPTVYKSGQNQHQRYAYVGHEDVMTSGVRETLASHGIVVVQTSISYVGEVPGGKTAVLLWRGTYRVLHESGEHLDLDIVGTSQGGDKCAYQVNTMIDRTVYLRLLALAGSSEEDVEDDRDHGRLRREAMAQQRAEAACSRDRAEAAPVLQQPPGYRADLDALEQRVATVRDEAELVDWAKQMRVLRTQDKREKEAGWKGFEARAAALKLDPLAVLKRADAELQKARDERAAAREGQAA